MNILMLYFSGTGNTELVSEYIAESMASEGHTVKMIPVETALRDQSLLKKASENDLLGIGYPVHDLKEPEIISRLIESLPFPSRRIPVFLYSTMAFIQGDCNIGVAKKLRKKDYPLIASHGFKCPSNGVYTYEKPDHPRYRNVRFEPNIDRAIKSFCIDVLFAFKSAQESILPKTGFLNPLNNVIRYFSERLYGDKYYKLLAVSNECSGCGICANLCPDENLYLRDSKAAVKNTDGCLRCLRCISNCPQTAISFTSSVIKSRYTRSVRDTLFKEAVKEQ